MAKKKKAKKDKKKAASTPAPSSYDPRNMVQVICGNCKRSTIVNPSIPGLKSCYYCGSALRLPKPKVEGEGSDGSEAGSEEDLDF